jgi:tryptophan halogenase
MAGSQPAKIRRVVVLGGGTAGFLAALAISRHVPDITVTVVRSKRLGVIGVGEATIVSIIPFLHRYLGLDSRMFHQRVRPSVKLGIRFLWGKRPWFHYTFSRQLSEPDPALQYPRGYFCRDEFDFADLPSALMTHNKVCMKRIDGRPALTSSFAYHLENRTFVDFLETIAEERGIPKIDDELAGVEKGPNGIKALVLKSGQRVEGDLFIDCSGFRSELLGKAMNEEFVSFKKALFCDRAIVGIWERTDDPYHPFTTAETMDAGWCWKIEHDEIINRGYVYCSAFLTDEQAEREFRAKNPKIDKVWFLDFPAGARRRSWVDNVVAIGNAAGFIEPLESTAIAMICDSVAHVVRSLQASDGVIEPVMRDNYNRIFFHNWEIFRDFLSIHYRFNDRLDTPFWQAARNDVCLGDIKPAIDYYKAVGPDLRLLNYDFKRDAFSTEGYLVLLVGQQVPYRRQIRIDAGQAEMWRERRRDLDRRARGGMDMAECLADLRANGLPGYGPTSATDPAGDRFGKDFGELFWH